MTAILNMTRHKTRFDELKEDQEFYKILFNHCQGMLCTHNRHGILLSINTAAASSLGYNTDELIGENLYDFLHPKEKPLFRRYLQLVFEKKVHKGEMAILHKNGETRTWAFQNSVIEQPECENIVIGSSIDITQQDRQEKQLKKSRQAYKSLVENIPGITYQCKHDAGRTLLYISAHIDKITGYSSEELLYHKTTSYRELIHPEDMDDAALAVEKAIKNNTPWETEYRVRHKSGYYRWAYEKGNAVKNEDGEINYLTGIILDVTEKKETEKINRQLNRDIQDITNAVNESSLVSITDKNGTIITANRQFCEISGYTEAELLGQNHRIINSGYHEPLFWRKMWKTISSGNVWKGDIKNRAKDGSKYWVSAVINPIFDKHGAITSYLSIRQNITDRKKAQEKNQSLLKITREQNSRLKNFAHIVTHNLRSHSAGIYGMLDLIKMNYPDIYANKYIQLMEEVGNNLKETIQNLTEIVSQSFDEEQELKKIKIKEAVERNISAAVTAFNKEMIKVINDVDDIELKVIPAYMDSIILNFLTNAVKYSSPDRESYVKIYSRMKKGYIQINFEDNGLGIDLDKYEDKLFGMHNTFHNHEDSRGIGLFITKNQIETMGGYIEVESEAGKGTTFKVYLPYTEEQRIGIILQQGPSLSVSGSPQKKYRRLKELAVFT